MLELYNYYERCLGEAVAMLQESLEKRLIALVLSGSLAKRTLVKGWSDIDLLAVCTDASFKAQTAFKEVKVSLEQSYNIHLGLSVATETEFFEDSSRVGELKLLLVKQNLALGIARFVYTRYDELREVKAPENQWVATLALSEINQYRGRVRKAVRDQVGVELLKSCIKCVFFIFRMALAKTERTCPYYDSIIDNSSEVFGSFPLGMETLREANTARYRIEKNDLDVAGISERIVDLVEEFVPWFERTFCQRG